MTHTIRQAIALLVLGLAAVAPSSAQTNAPEPLRRSDFAAVAPQGFGDRDNSQTWGTVWFRDALYVGTGRATYCVQQATLELFQPFPDPFPPQDEDVVCPDDPHDIPLQAEIWRWTPADGSWTRVHQAPMDVPILGTDKFTSRDIGYRGMVVFPERQRDGSVKRVLYVSAVSSRGAQGVGFNGPVPPPRILRSEDGERFTPVPQDPGTFMGDTLVSGFRTLKAFHGKLYVVASVGLLGHGIILESEQPWLGNDAFRQVSPPDLRFFEIETYNGFLYAGTGGQPANNDPPFRLLKTNAKGEPPYTFTEVIPEAAYRTSLRSAAVISMREFKNRLFVGTDRELLRVNPDDSWDLVIGTPRDTPAGLKVPLGGMNIGFDSVFGIHMWRMTDSDGWLYIGTQDQSTKWRNLSIINSLLEPGMGFDLYATNDGWHFTRISRNGFDDLFNNGVRNFVSTPAGFFLGTANHYYGLQIHRAPRPPEALPPAVAAPKLVELEMIDDAALLSWEPSPGAVRYHVFRDSWFKHSEEIATIDGLTDESWFYVDDETAPNKQNHYFVVAENGLGALSEASNIGRKPAITVVPTFGMLRPLMAVGGAPASMLKLLAAAQAHLEKGNHDTSLMLLRRLRGYLRGRGRGSMSAWRAEDLDLLVVRLMRRVRLAKAGVIPEPLVVG